PVKPPHSPALRTRPRIAEPDLKQMIETRILGGKPLREHAIKNGFGIALRHASYDNIKRGRWGKPMNLHRALALVLALSLVQAARADEAEDAAAFTANVDECIRLQGERTEAHRRSCLKDYAWSHVTNIYRRAARDHVWNDFRNDYPDFAGPNVNLMTKASAI